MGFIKDDETELLFQEFDNNTEQLEINIDIYKQLSFIINNDTTHGYMSDLYSDSRYITLIKLGLIVRLESHKNTNYISDRKFHYIVSNKGYESYKNYEKLIEVKENERKLYIQKQKDNLLKLNIPEESKIQIELILNLIENSKDLKVSEKSIRKALKPMKKVGSNVMYNLISQVIIEIGKYYI